MVIGLKRGMVVLSDHQAAWETAASQAIDQLRRIFGDLASDIQHVGSTAIRTIKAKPIIDIAVAVDSFAAVTALLPALEQNGFFLRQHAVADDLLLVRGDLAADIRTHHIHVVKGASKAWQDYLVFRDYLNACPQAAGAYETAKLQLMHAHPHDRLAYTTGKTAFIRQQLREAMTWRYLGRTVLVTIDRPLGSLHPRTDTICYSVNYGYVDGVYGGDGHLQDAYVLGVDQPISTFSGPVLAVIHRLDDEEDKWVVGPAGARLTRAEIRQETAFVEQFFQTEIRIAGQASLSQA